MAYLVYGKCKKCGEEFRTMINSSGESSNPSLCDNCKREESDIKRREYFYGLDGLTIEERLRRVEEWIYNYKPYKEPRF